METGIEVVEEGILRILLPGIGVGKHSFATRFVYFLTEICQGDLLFVPEVLRIYEVQALLSLTGL